MAEAADADDADTRGWIDAVDAEGIVDSDAATEQGRGLLAGEPVRHGNNEAGVGADAIGVAAVAMNAGAFSFRAEILHAAHAPLADAAGVGLPAEADALAYLETAYITADGCD